MRRKMEQMQGEVNEFMDYVKHELVARARRLGTAPLHRAGQVVAHRSGARESAPVPSERPIDPRFRSRGVTLDRGHEER